MIERARTLLRLLYALGIRHALAFKAQQRAWFTGPYRLTTKRAKHPVWVRPNTSDAGSFWQVFIGLEYAKVRLSDPELIIDCGANVGYVSAYLLSRYPTAELIAIEPDPGNVEMLRRNLEPYGDRVTILESGVWSHVCPLKVLRFPGREMDTMVREAEPHEEPDLWATSLAEIIGDRTVDFLKIDVEGSESELFRDPSWLPKVDQLLVETHYGRTGPPTEPHVLAGLSLYPFDIARDGRIVTATRMGAMAIAALVGA